MAAAYGAGLGVFAWLAFRCGAWIFDTGVGAWCRYKDNKQSKETAR